jgi:FixJ family two-component response regulator
VETHRANLFAKLQVDYLAHLIRHYATLAAQADRQSPLVP